MRRKNSVSDRLLEPSCFQKIKRKILLDAGEVQQVSRSERFVGMLENAGATWFWECDRDGRLMYISPPALTKLVGEAGDMSALTLAHLVDATQPLENEDAQRSLAFYMSTRTAFDGVIAKARADQDQWLSISGRPVTDSLGRFLGFIGWANDLSKQHRSEVELNKLATFDALTGLLNRQAITRLAERSIESVSRRATRCSLMLLDLDRFKDVNDRLGHAAGDVLLKLVALRLRQIIPQQNHVGRLGGDEFLIVLPDLCDVDALSELAELLVSSLGQPYHVKGVTVSVGASLGLTTTYYDNISSADLLHQADLALYAAKNSGRSTFRFYKPELEQAQSDRVALQNDLRAAIEEDSLLVVYQPSVSLSSDKVTAFEALVRWPHPEQGLIPPSIFVPIAEETGLIRPLGEWVLRTACRDASSWPNDVKVAVNVSPIQMADVGLPKMVARILTEASLPASRLELEVTESVLLNNDPIVSNVIQGLVGVGVSLALDDFGTGYSSLAYLYKAPFKKIKIDRSFVQSDRPVALNTAVIQSVVLLARALNMEVTAEGVETDAELALVRELGCTNVQGYFFSEPIPLAATSQFLDDDKHGASRGIVPRSPRRKILLAAKLHTPCGVFPIRVRDISRRGALVDRADVPTGSLVTLELSPHCVIEANVQWAKSGKAGLRFQQDFDLACLDRTEDPRPSHGLMRPAYLGSRDNANHPDQFRKSRLTVKDLY